MCIADYQYNMLYPGQYTLRMEFHCCYMNLHPLPVLLQPSRVWLEVAGFSANNIHRRNQ